MVVLSFASAAFAQQPFVPKVIATPGSPSRALYAVYNGALVRSSDLGSTWIPVYVTEPGLPQPPVKGFEIDLLNPDTLYLATTVADGSVWKSADGGATWAKANTGLPATGAAVDYFRQVQDSGTLLYAKIGQELYRSSDGAASWSRLGLLPGSAGTMAIAESQHFRMYYVEPATLQVFTTSTGGASWELGGQITGPALSNTAITAMAVLYSNPGSLYVNLEGSGTGQGAYASKDFGATFADQTASGLGEFSQILSSATGPMFALTQDAVGTYRSTDQGESWQAIGFTGNRYGVTAWDPSAPSTVYGIQTALGAAAPVALVTSTDAGDSWSAIPATISPTIAKPAAIFKITLEQGAPYSAPFTIQTAEDATWKTAVTVSTSGEPWLQLGASSGSTPLQNSISISSAGLPPGSYSSTLTISAAQSFNKSVSVPVQLTIVPLGSGGQGYVVSTVAGSGALTGTRISGSAASLGIGAAKALAFDPSGKLDISSGSRIWQLDSGNLRALAGNGIDASTGDQADPLAVSIADPDALAFDSQGNLYWTEYSSKRVRKLAIGGVDTVVDMGRSPSNLPVGSHSLGFDALGRILLTGPSGLLRFPGTANEVAVAIPYAFSDPYGMAADASGNLYVSDRNLNRIFKITPAGVISPFAGTGVPGFSGDGGPALDAQLSAPAGLAFDSLGMLYIADSVNNRIRAIGPDGTIRTIAGSGLSGFAGDGLTSDFASFQNPLDVAVDSQENVYVADSGNNRVRMLSLKAGPAPEPAALLGPSRSTKLAPGGLFALYGTQLAPPGASAQASAVSWPRSMAKVRVSINGIDAPLYFVSPTQINGQI
ncbi:MAG TPA: hypothetical protein VFW83_03975, partial [Bryobacteraceae bacterium]|nr:hypothetical protein [Bryobacteraceae bacterium]